MISHVMPAQAGIHDLPEVAQPGGGSASVLARRPLLLGMLGLGGCSVLRGVPYAQRRDWPLEPRRHATLPPTPNGPVLLVRGMGAAPGLDTRGLQWLLPDGSVHVDFYEEWAVPPAQATEEALRRWLAAAGQFAAVLTSGSRMPPDLVLESELLTLTGEPARQRAHAAIALVLLDQHEGRTHVLLQSTLAATTPVSGDGPPALVAALRVASADVLRQAERAIAPIAAAWRGGATPKAAQRPASSPDRHR